MYSSTVSSNTLVRFTGFFTVPFLLFFSFVQFSTRIFIWVSLLYPGRRLYLGRLLHHISRRRDADGITLSIHKLAGVLVEARAATATGLAAGPLTTDSAQVDEPPHQNHAGHQKNRTTQTRFVRILTHWMFPL